MQENEAIDKHSILFMGLVTSFQQNALLALGKMVNPASGKTERDLSTASAFIDMLDMLKAKTHGNLSDDETKMLEEIVGHLKLNYVEEVNKPDVNTEGADAPNEQSESGKDETTTLEGKSEEKEE